MSALWQSRPFLRLFVSTLCFSLGTQIYALAMPLVMYELTHSVGTMTAMRAVELLPNLLLAMFIGVWVDRIDRGRSARFAVAGMVLLMGVQAGLLQFGARAVPAFYVSAFVLMTLNYLYAISRLGMLKEMLPGPLLLPATGQLATLDQVFTVLGPALAGGLLAWSLQAGFWVPMVCMALAALLLRKLELPVRRPQAGPYWSDFAEGWRALRGNRPMWQLTWWVVLINGSAGVAETLFLFRARDVLGLEPGALGMLYGIAGVGGILGGLLASRIRQRIGLGPLLCLSLAFEALAMLGLAYLPLGIGLVLALALKNFGTLLGNVCTWGLRQETTDATVIGRVSGLTGSIFKLAMPLSLVASGALSAAWPVGLVIAGCAVAHGVALIGVRSSAVWRVV